MSNKDERRDRIIAATMDLIGQRGWLGLSLADIAEYSGVPLAELVDQFNNKTQILAAWADQLDRQTLAGDIEASTDSPRDRLFELLMRRFDIMAPNRAAVRNLADELGADPWTVICGAPRAWQSMALALEASGVSTSGLSGALKVQGLATLHWSVLRTWLRDDTVDQSPTMAALDKALRRGEWLAGLIWRPRRRTRESPVAEPGPAA